MTDDQRQGAPAPGWYADPTGHAGVRWWDGEQWTAHSAPLPAGAAPDGVANQRLPETTPVYTSFIWLIVVLPLLSVIALLFWQPDVGLTRLRGASSFDPLSIYTPGYFLVLGLGFLVQVLTIVFAYLDYRALRARGVARPFHWAFSFFTFISPGGLVYPIARSVVMHRIARPRGLVPIWVLIGVYVVSLVIAGIWVATFLSRFMAEFSQIATSGS